MNKSVVACPFCGSKELKKRVIVKNELAWAFPTNIPVVPGHTLISPLRHVGGFADVTAKENSAMKELLNKITAALRRTFGAEGFNFAWNEGRVAGQSVPHLHLHVLPRRPGDTGITEYEPRKFLYRPGSRAESPEAELKAVAELIRRHL